MCVCASRDRKKTLSSGSHFCGGRGVIRPIKKENSSLLCAPALREERFRVERFPTSLPALCVCVFCSAVIFVCPFSLPSPGKGSFCAVSPHIFFVLSFVFVLFSAFVYISTMTRNKRPRAQDSWGSALLRDFVLAVVASFLEGFRSPMRSLFERGKK